jgi:LysM repeat protein
MKDQEKEDKTIISSTNMKDDQKEKENQNVNKDEVLSAQKTPEDKSKKVNLSSAVGVGAAVAAAAAAAGVVVGAKNSDEVNEFIDGAGNAVNETVSSLNDVFENQVGEEVVNDVNESEIHNDVDNPLGENETVYDVAFENGLENFTEDLVELTESDLQYEDAIFSNEESGTIEYVIQSGDTLSEIAAANNTTIEHLMAVNPNITDPDVIFAGDNLTIPTGDGESNPYAAWDANEINTDSETENDFEFNAPEENPEFAQVDWASFEDEPISEIEIDEYSDVAEVTDYSDEYITQNESFTTSEDIHSTDENYYTTEESYSFTENIVSGDEIAGDQLSPDEYYITEDEYSGDYNSEFESTDFESGDYGNDYSADDSMDWSC